MARVDRVLFRLREFLCQHHEGGASGERVCIRADAW